MAPITRSHAGKRGNAAEIPDDINPTELLEAFIKRVGGRPVNQALYPMTSDALIKGFLALRSGKFDGLGGPEQAGQWLRDMEYILRTMEYSDSEKIRLATGQLTFLAAKWWNAEKATRGEEATQGMPWKAFREKFMVQFFCDTDINEMEHELLNLVREYTDQFDRLARFAHYLVDAHQQEVNQGFNTFTRYLIQGCLNQSCGALVKLANGLKDDRCRT